MVGAAASPVMRLRSPVPLRLAMGVGRPTPVVSRGLTGHLRAPSAPGRQLCRPATRGDQPKGLDRLAIQGDRNPEGINESMALFELGRVTATAATAAYLTELDMALILALHSTGDGGGVDEEDWATNNDAVLNGGRLISAYQVGDRKVWVITESDRSCTTVLFPDEY